MTRIRKIPYRVSACGLGLLSCLLLEGCFSVMSYQTADTVPAGGVEFGMGWSLTKIDQFEVTDDQGQTYKANTDQVGTIPNVLPDLMLRIGATDDLDVGLRLFFLGIHADVKWRFLDIDYFSMAIAPGASYSRPFFFFAEYGAELPVLFTIKPLEWFHIYGGIKGRFSGWNMELYVDENNKNEDNLYTFGVGGHFGLHFGGTWWFVRPEIGYTHYVVGFNGPCEGGVKMSLFTFGLGFGFRVGVPDKKQEEKLDRIEKRLDELEKDKPKPAGGEKEDAVRERAGEAFEDLEKEEEKRE